jgi:prephenate dehydrogenase
MKPRLTIIGLGWLGTSIGLALKKTGADLEIVGHDKNRDAISAAQKAGAVDRGEWNLYNACDGAGLIILSMPLAGVLENIHLLRNDLPPGVIVTDTASVKAPVLDAAKEFDPRVHYIGGNPIFRPSPDGTVNDTIANADIFQDAVYCLTPTLNSDPDAVQVLTGYVAMLGAKPLFLDPAEHDGLVAGAQHLATAMQAALLKTTTGSSGWRELNKFAGVDFFHATDLATRDASSTAQLLIAQREPLQQWLDLCVQSMRDLRMMLNQKDTAALEKWLKTAQVEREQWLLNKVGESVQASDFSQVKSGALRMFVGGLADRFGGEKKK